MYTAISADAFWDIPLNDKMELTGQVAFVWYNRGYNEVAASGMGAASEAIMTTLVRNAGSGMGFYGDLGFRYDA